VDYSKPTIRISARDSQAHYQRQTTRLFQARRRLRLPNHYIKVSGHNFGKRESSHVERLSQKSGVNQMNINLNQTSVVDFSAYRQIIQWRRSLLLPPIDHVALPVFLTSYSPWALGRRRKSFPQTARCAEEVVAHKSNRLWISGQRSKLGLMQRQHLDRSKNLEPTRRIRRCAR
jgi:hypothetical protein